MPLSRGEGPIRVVGEGSAPSVVGPEVHGSHVDGAHVEDVPEGTQAVVIAIAGSVQERLRIVEAVGSSAAVVMVASRAEAMDILAGSPGVSSGSGTEVPSGPGFGHPPAAYGVTVAHQPAAHPSHARPSYADLSFAQQPPRLEVDSDWRVAAVGDREVGLSPLEHDLLVCLLDDVGHIHTFESIQRSVWGNDHLGGRSHVQSVVKRLRRKLTDLVSPLQIDAVRGVGLRLVDAARDRALDSTTVVLPQKVHQKVPQPLTRPLSPTDPRLVPRPVRP